MPLPLTAQNVVSEPESRLVREDDDLVPTIDRSFQDQPVARSVGNRLAFLGEVSVAVSAALVSVQLSRSIEVDPLDRLGQVSGIAALELRFMALALVVLVMTIAAVRAGRLWVFPLVSRLACAAVAGLSTGLIAGGLVVALRGTDWSLYADWGDAGQIARWAGSVMAGGSMPAEYPPLAIHVMAWLAELTNSSPSNALQLLQVVGTALCGPVAYLSWRLLLRPVWALGIGLVTALPLIDPYKPYTNVVLIVLLPTVIKSLQLLQKSGTLPWRRIAVYGAVAGAAAGLLFLPYSAWVRLVGARRPLRGTRGVSVAHRTPARTGPAGRDSRGVHRSCTCASARHTTGGGQGPGHVLLFRHLCPAGIHRDVARRPARRPRSLATARRTRRDRSPHSWWSAGVGRWPSVAARSPSSCWAAA